MPSGPEFAAIFDEIHDRAVEDGLKNQPVLSTLGLQLLALLSQQQEGASAAPADRLVERARVLLMERCADQMPVEEIARELGVSYSYFRRVFKEKTGASPKQHQMALRIRRTAAWANEVQRGSPAQITRTCGMATTKRPPQERI